MSLRRADSRFRRWSFILTVLFVVHQAALGQGSYTAQVRGTVTDPAHAVLNNAKVTVTNESTSIETTATTNAGIKNNWTMNPADGASTGAHVKSATTHGPSAPLRAEDRYVYGFPIE